MLSVQLICVGKLKEAFYADAMAEYSKRLSAFCKLTVTELAEQRLPDAPSPAQIEAALFKEAADIRAKLPQSGTLVALCVEGSLLSSEALAGKLEAWAVSGASRLSFVIGGSCGLHPSIKEQASLKLSMSPMTFPHHLARVMLVEQLYRGFQINSGSKYHK
ncbi:MAG: rlmH [Oscillospiraceae bacterium]|nr:rlmH [Oscillospiraceae bacterium]